MKAKLFEIEAYTIAETTRKLGYKSSKTIYRLKGYYAVHLKWSPIIGFPTGGLPEFHLAL